jgi:hypothetical protein
VPDSVASPATANGGQAAPHDRERRRGELRAVARLELRVLDLDAVAPRRGDEVIAAVAAGRGSIHEAVVRAGLLALEHHEEPGDRSAVLHDAAAHRDCAAGDAAVTLHGLALAAEYVGDSGGHAINAALTGSNA